MYFSRDVILRLITGTCRPRVKHFPFKTEYVFARQSFVKQKHNKHICSSPWWMNVSATMVFFFIPKNITCFFSSKADFWRTPVYDNNSGFIDTRWFNDKCYYRNEKGVRRFGIGRICDKFASFFTTRYLISCCRSGDVRKRLFLQNNTRFPFSWNMF